jgi:hypothetical protein
MLSEMNLEVVLSLVYNPEIEEIAKEVRDNIGSALKNYRFEAFK